MIKVENLSFTYPHSSKEVISNINFNIKEGEIFGFLGPSGAGKTTTQRIIIGLLTKYQGSVQVFGSERSQCSKDFFERIGVAFDFPNLYLKLTAKENLELINNYYKNKNSNIDHLLEQVGLIENKNQRVEGFSKGMKMRLNFIRAILHSPDLLFFDEPTSGLDPVNAKIIKDMIIQLKKEGKTIFLTTHNMTVAEQLCDQVAFVVDGTIPIIGSPKQLMLDYGNKSIWVEYLSNKELFKKSFDLNQIKTNPEFIDLIKTKEVSTLHTQEASLEDVFIKITGKELI